MTATLRRSLLGLALVLTWVGMLVDGPDAEPPASAVPAAASRRPDRPAGAPASVPEPAARRPLGGMAGNPFAVRQWQPPVLPAPIAAPMVAASAPAIPRLPFVYVGQLQEQGRTTVFLGQGARTHLVHAGDVVGDYQVVSIGATAILFLHLALQQQQSLNFGSSQ